MLRIPGSKVILCSLPDLECGFARDLFALWCSNPRHLVVLTTRCGPDTLCRKLLDNPGLTTVTLEIKQRVKLEGAELEEFRRKEREKNGLLMSQKNKDQVVESSDESESEEMSRNAKAPRHDIVVRSSDGSGNKITGPGGAVQHSFFKSSKKNTMFPYFEDKVKFDEYG